jgi:hypothetical protein
VFRNAFERWIDEDNEQDFPALVREALQQVTALAAGA